MLNTLLFAKLETLTRMKRELPTFPLCSGLLRPLNFLFFGLFLSTNFVTIFYFIRLFLFSLNVHLFQTSNSSFNLQQHFVCLLVFYFLLLPESKMQIHSFHAVKCNESCPNART